MKNSPLIPALLSLLLVIPFSCKKYIQQQEQNALVSIVTKGTWRVTGYNDQQTTNLTDSFAGYSFQFNENGTLYTVKYGQQTNGTWSANIGNKTITSSFPEAAYPINLLNYTWTITDSYTDSVAAKTAVGGSFNILNLHKN
jgi:hypothetical protein